MAILLLANETDDLDAPLILRKFLLLEFNFKGYGVKSLSETDSILRILGITDGGQLVTITPKELADSLKVLGLVYGRLTNYALTISGFYNRIELSAEFRLLDPRGKELWQDKGSINENELDLSRPLKNFLTRLMGAFLMNLIWGDPLYLETQELINQIGNTIPPPKLIFP